MIGLWQTYLVLHGDSIDWEQSQVFSQDATVKDFYVVLCNSKLVSMAWHNI